jgi:Ser/Thr protein kinase RdoA (MazF antagonist)
MAIGPEPRAVLPHARFAVVGLLAASAVVDAADLLRVLARWERGPLSVVPVQGGWNSTVWLVRAAEGRRYVAKLADAAERTGFRSGLRVARRAAERGFRSGPAVPLPDGSLHVCVPGGAVALLEYVQGRRADVESVADLRRMGGALARAHGCLAAEVECLDPSLVWPWPWAEDAVARIPMPAEVSDAVRRALDDARRVTAVAGLLVQVVHGDPAVDAFVLDAARVEDDGMIDWSATVGAPALYDLGTVAAVYRRHPGRLAAFVQGYIDVEPAIADQLRFLETFTRLRWMCTALYFADRITRGIVRGGPPEANRLGLAEAHAELNSDAHG